MNRYKVPPCGVWAGCTRTHIERAQRYFKLSSSCIVALVLRYRAAWDNKHVCVCATGHLEHYWKLHGFALSSIVADRYNDSDAGRAGRCTLGPERPADPRVAVEAETRVTGRPAAPARYALSFMF